MWMVIGDHQVTTAFFEGDHRIMDVGRNDARVELITVSLEFGEPFWKERH
ncbi:unnamed protein product [marine sediment metagenome]|uniref:Uncharacterized protein n=1 Tax=marine sediment metagenome TaxID=412755 RepID=X1LWL7_9ZZZZ